MKKIIKKSIGSLILIAFWALMFVSDVMVHGLLYTIVKWIITVIGVALIFLAVYLLFSN